MNRILIVSDDFHKAHKYAETAGYQFNEWAFRTTERHLEMKSVEPQYLSVRYI